MDELLHDLGLWRCVMDTMSCSASQGGISGVKQTSVTTVFCQTGCRCTGISLTPETAGALLLEVCQLLEVLQEVDEDMCNLIVWDNRSCLPAVRLSRRA